MKFFFIAGLTIFSMAWGEPAVPQAATTPAQQKKLPAVRTEIVDGARKLTVVDLSARFLDFHQSASRADADTRWALWQEKYGFAAVPPGPEGQKIARRLLEEAWPRYAAILPLVRAGAASMEPRPDVVLRNVATLLGLERPFEMDVIVYVGAFDGNAYTASQAGKPFVAIPLEMDARAREAVFHHEMTHAVHIATAGLSGGWERSIAETIMQEGLAMHASRVLVPGRDVREYIEHKPGWYEAALAKRAAILEGILPVLEKSDGQTVFTYTMGKGTTGTEREAYLAGWLVVGELLKKGRTFPEIARIPAEDMPQLIRETIAEM